LHEPQQAAGIEFFNRFFRDPANFFGMRCALGKFGRQFSGDGNRFKCREHRR
jgi:hypothetical protein